MVPSLHIGTENCPALPSALPGNGQNMTSAWWGLGCAGLGFFGLCKRQGSASRWAASSAPSFWAAPRCSRPPLSQQPRPGAGSGRRAGGPSGGIMGPDNRATDVTLPAICSQHQPCPCPPRPHRFADHPSAGAPASPENKGSPSPHCPKQNVFPQILTCLLAPGDMPMSPSSHCHRSASCHPPHGDSGTKGLNTPNHSQHPALCQLSIRP